MQFPPYTIPDLHGFIQMNLLPEYMIFLLSMEKVN